MKKIELDTLLGPITNTEWTIIKAERDDKSRIIFTCQCSCGVVVSHHKDKMTSIARPRMCASCTKKKGRKNKFFLPKSQRPVY